MSAPRILVVDDEADLRELLEITLLKMGLDVDSAATVREARSTTPWCSPTCACRTAWGWNWCAKWRVSTATRRSP
jgi:DNA-binding NtrC family response regulator